MSWITGKSIKRRMMIVAIVNGILIFGSVYFLAKAIEIQKDDALLVNLAGRQRMLTQRMAKACFALSSNHLSEDESQEMLGILKDSRHLYDKTLHMFLEGGMTELNSIQVSTPPISKHEKTIGELHVIWNECQKSIDIIIETMENHQKTSTQYFNAVKVIIEKNEMFLWKTDEIVTLLQVDAEEHIMKVKQQLLLIVLLEIVILLVFMRSIDIGILNPFKRLFSALESVGRGENYVPSQKEIYSEWIQTEEHICEMSKKLIGAREALSQLNHDLEEKVKLRTADLKATIEKLESTYKKLLESEKQASLGALVAGVAHEINTPLGVCLTGSTQLKVESEQLIHKIKNNQMTKEDLKEYLKISHELIYILEFNINRAADIIKSFKKIAIHQSTEIIETFYLDEYINDLWVSLSHVTKKYEVSFENELSHERIFGDPGDYSQIFTNLFMNTFTHGYHPGDQVRIIVTSFSSGMGLIIKYKDYGKGISPSSITKIFDPFYTTNRAGGGSGLGLNVIYQIIVNKLGGEITCDSEKDRYTEFTIRISKFKEADYE